MKKYVKLVISKICNEMHDQQNIKNLTFCCAFLKLVHCKHNSEGRGYIERGEVLKMHYTMHEDVSISTTYFKKQALHYTCLHMIL